MDASTVVGTVAVETADEGLSKQVSPSSCLTIVMASRRNGCKWRRTRTRMPARTPVVCAGSALHLPSGRPFYWRLSDVRILRRSGHWRLSSLNRPQQHESLMSKLQGFKVWRRRSRMSARKPSQGEPVQLYRDPTGSVFRQRLGGVEMEETEIIAACSYAVWKCGAAKWCDGRE